MTKGISKLTIELDGIGHTLSDNKMSVPIYQRSYAWEEIHVTDLYDDLFTSIRNNDDEYFIGSLVISSGTESDEVVDGQQRLATISILLAAIRDYFNSNGDSERANHIQNQYLSNRDRRTQEVIPNLNLNHSDNSFFYNTIIMQPSNGEKPTRASHDKLLKAYNLAKSKIRAYVTTSNNPTTSLLDLCDFIDEHLKIIVVKVPNHANAFTIFETLNDRGLELAISDLLKNYLLGQADNRLAEVQDNWTKMYSLLENTENESLVVTFLRQYWSSVYGLTRERDLYKKIKERITSKQRAIDFSNNLEEAARTYVALIDTTNAYWSDFSPASKVHMETLNLFGMTQIRPLILSIMRKFERKESEKALMFLVNVCVRFLIGGGLGGGFLENQFSERAKDVSEGIIPDTKELKLKLKDVIPSDTQFKEAFQTASVSKQYLARYYLITLEKANNSETKPELVPNSDTLAVNLEHVLPKNLSAEWKIDPDIHRAYLKRLGNLALMSSKLNSDIGNASFIEKKEFYLTSSFSLTRSIASSDDWGIKEINERQEVMANLALKAWKI
ncbi:Uncharacterized conserved protein, contains ParB-like and HNH nuclease domains [Pedobacter westerhofensis]|uniref:Uncharacterized conserved protein, contains ParB-like and HNH nuclease domains n=1 Tax=Pedobacter westerhofensis TaxID=425512 RepID=A0A521FUH8_9SPHI|nr:DUF262 domain-containing protein [Pedobacter westerhofensis]SMO99754.1 Uncharacterized conserved protein, contains ParB-like and HNH nuclease domains [Pedobacter westerhofensis]